MTAEVFKNDVWIGRCGNWKLPHGIYAAQLSVCSSDGNYRLYLFGKAVVKPHPAGWDAETGDFGGIVCIPYIGNMYGLFDKFVI